MGKRGAIPMFLWVRISDERKALPRLDMIFDVHGSLTYSGGDGIYPVPSEGLWWFGFDCGHCFDARDPVLCTTRTARYLLAVDQRWQTDAVVRDLEYVVGQCEKLAQQLAEVIPAWKPLRELNDVEAEQ